LPNQYSALTRENILRKMNRKRNPVTSVAELAREFGEDTQYDRHTPTFLWGATGVAATKSFRTKIKALVGEDKYNQLRDERFVNHSYR
jgi:hypothetical protein